MIGDIDIYQFLQRLDVGDFLRIILVLFAAWIITSIVERFITKKADLLPQPLRIYVLPFVPILRLITLLGSIAFVFPQIVQPSFESMVAILGAVGLTLGFAFKDYASSLIAGVVTLYERPYRPGDWITIDGTYGEVRTIGLRSVHLVTPDDTEVIIPHQYFWNSSVHNANSGARDLMCVAEFYLHPEHNAFLARHKLREVAVTSPYLNLNRPISVVVMEKPWGTLYRVKAYPIDSRDQFQFLSDMTVRGKQALKTIGAQPSIAPMIAMENNI